MVGAGKLGHVGAGFGGDHVRGTGADPGDGADQVAESAKGFDHHLDPGGELRDDLVVVVDQVEVGANQEAVMIGEPPGQGLDQGPGLAAHRPVRQRGQPLGVAFPLGQCH